MRETEKAALQEVTRELQNIAKTISAILAGKAIEAAAPVAASKPKFRMPTQKAAPAVDVPEGQHIEWDEDSAAFGCLVCKPATGPYKISEIAVHAYEEHGIPLVQLQGGEGLTHARKWQMKKALEKAAPDALIGYGRGAAAPAEEVEAAPTKKGWMKKQPAKAAAEEPEETLCKPWQRFGVKEPGFKEPPELEDHIAIWHPKGDDGHTVPIVLKGKWKPDSKNYLALLLDDSFKQEAGKNIATGELVVVPKKEVSLISPYKISDINQAKLMHGLKRLHQQNLQSLHG